MSSTRTAQQIIDDGDPLPVAMHFNGLTFEAGMEAYKRHRRHSEDVAAVDSEVEPSVLSFFSGRSHQDGLNAYNQHLAEKAKRS